MPVGLNPKRHAFVADVRESGFDSAMETHQGMYLLDKDGYIGVLDNGSIELCLDCWSAPHSISPRLARFIIEENYPDCPEYADLFMDYVRETINQYDPAEAERRSDK